MSVVDKTATWYEPTVQALAALRQLCDNWDGQGARNPDPAVAAAAISLLRRVMRDDTPAPSVVPTTRGGIQLEWHLRGIDLDVEFLSPVSIQGFFEDGRTGDSWEEDLSTDLSPLADAISKLSSR